MPTHGVVIMAPGKNCSNEVFNIFCAITNSLKRNKHCCFIRVSDCSIRVSQSFATSYWSKVGSGITAYLSPFSAAFVHYIIAVLLRIPLNWSIDMRYIHECKTVHKIIILLQCMIQSSSLLQTHST